MRIMPCSANVEGDKLGNNRISPKVKHVRAHIRCTARNSTQVQLSDALPVSMQRFVAHDSSGILPGYR